MNYYENFSLEFTRAKNYEKKNLGCKKKKRGGKRWNSLKRMLENMWTAVILWLSFDEKSPNFTTRWEETELTRNETTFFKSYFFSLKFSNLCSHFWCINSTQHKLKKRKNVTKSSQNHLWCCQILKENLGCFSHFFWTFEFEREKNNKNCAGTISPGNKVKRKKNKINRLNCWNDAAKKPLLILAHRGHPRHHLLYRISVRGAHFKMFYALYASKIAPGLDFYGKRLKSRWRL